MSDSATRHRLTGLEPDNLLAFLALLGLLRALETTRLEWSPRAGWDVDEPPLRPFLQISPAVTPEVICEAAVAGIMKLAPHYHFGESPDHTAGAKRDLDYDTQTARKLLQEISNAEDRVRADIYATLLCDAAEKDGKIEATPLCLLFGQGHQHFLERLALVPKMEAPPPRGRGQRAVTLSAVETIDEALFRPWTREDPTPSFRWDPAEDVRYALRADDPSGEKSTTQHGANRLAAIGLAALTVSPVQRGERVRLQVLGGSFSRSGFSFCWPIWRDAASLAAIRALLSHPALLEGPAALAHLGVTEVRRTRRISNGKFMNFTRAEAVVNTRSASIPPIG